MFTLIRFYFGSGLTHWEVLVSVITYCFQFVHFVQEPQNFIAVQRKAQSDLLDIAGFLHKIIISLIQKKRAFWNE